VNLKRVIRHLRREALANPKKAAILGLLALVALYYWAPLVRGWIVPGEASVKPPVAEGDAELAPGAPAESAPAGPSTPSPKETPSYAWTQLDQWMREDPTTTPPGNLADWRDPFAVASAGAELALDEEVQREDAEVTPETLGMKLSATLLGPRRRVALIDGKAYREGQTVRINQNDQPIEFRLVEVLSQQIVLDRDGRRFGLRIPQRKTTGRIEPFARVD